MKEPNGFRSSMRDEAGPSTDTHRGTRGFALLPPAKLVPASLPFHIEDNLVDDIVTEIERTCSLFRSSTVLSPSRTPTCLTRRLSPGRKRSKIHQYVSTGTLFAQFQRLGNRKLGLGQVFASGSKETDRGRLGIEMIEGYTWQRSSSAEKRREMDALFGCQAGRILEHNIAARDAQAIHWNSAIR